MAELTVSLLTCAVIAKDICRSAGVLCIHDASVELRCVDVSVSTPADAVV
jgi:hypothetical protein